MTDAASSRPLPRVPQPLLRPLAWAYGAGVAMRNQAFDRHLRRSAAIDLPVISVGNIVVGGSGKTPTTAWLARRLLDRGHRPMIALRGYGAAKPEASDEAMEYATRLPDVPLAVGGDRVATIERVRATLGDSLSAPDVILLDDGFQHRQVRRTLDLVLIDAGRPCLDGPGAALLPLGWLREPPAAIRRADAVLLTHADEVDEAELAAVIAAVTRHHGQPPLAAFRHCWTAVQRFEQSDAHGAEPGPIEPRADAPTPEASKPHRSSPPSPVGDRLDLSVLRGLRVATLLGVAQPQRVQDMLASTGAVVVEDIPARDHQRYDEPRIAEVASIARRAEALFTTPKDWTKLARHAKRLGVPVLVPVLEVEPMRGKAELMATLERCIRQRSQ